MGISPFAGGKRLGRSGKPLVHLDWKESGVEMPGLSSAYGTRKE